MVAARGPGIQEDMGSRLFPVSQAHGTLGGSSVRLHQGLGYSGCLGGGEWVPYSIEMLKIKQKIITTTKH